MCGKLLVFRLRLLIRARLADTAGAGQHTPFIKNQKIVQLIFPVFEKDLFATVRLVLSIIEPHHHDPVQFRNLIFHQVILGHRDIGFPDNRTFPGGEPQVWLRVVGPFSDQFRCRSACGCKVQLIPHDLEKTGGLRDIWPIIGGEGENFFHSQIHSALAGTDVPNSIEKFVEIIGYSGTLYRWVLESIVVEGETLDQVFSQTFRGPTAELDAAFGANPVSDREDSVQI